MGVITIGRLVPQNPFSQHDVTLIEVIAERLATVLSNIHMQEQRKELFTSLAHEITTPLTGILAESENLVESLQGQPEMQRQAQEALTRVLRLHLLTKTILGVLSKPNLEREFKYVNIAKILKQARDLFAAEAIYKGCGINEPQSVEDPFPNIEMSEVDLSIAIQNVVHNAVKYSFYPSPKQERSRFIKLYGKFSDQSKMHYKIVVQNFGIGISQDEIRKRTIFESFVRGENATDRSRTGAGFGLAYARQIIEDMHGGRIGVTSVPLEGKAYLTTFTITLPVYQKYRGKK